ncbi:MAG: MoaD/ThiS family protein [Candidatus Bathyarchaeota archaeon]|jgi:MoaD family protein|nr:MoaD/ThiS family protein [Candidatus Bathyarchaeota archaeon]
MRINVRVFGEISDEIGKKHSPDLENGVTVGVLLERLSKSSGQRNGYLGEFRIGATDLAVLLNGKNIELIDGLSTKLKNEDEIVILQPTAGG